MAEISGGLYFLPRTSTQASPLSPLTILYGSDLHRLLDFGVVEAAADEALDREDRVLGVGDGLAPGDLADQPLARYR